MDNLEEYDSHEVYDAEYGNFGREGEFFLNLSSMAKIGIVDLACGTGRLTIPIATARNLPVFGVDLSEPMIIRAREKTQNANINWICEDVIAYQPVNAVDFAMMGGNAFQALLTRNDQLLFLNNLSNYLSPQGYFVFGVRNPKTYPFSSGSSDLEFWHEFSDFRGQAVQVWGREDYDSESQIVEFFTQRRWPDRKTETTIKLRFDHFDQIRELITLTHFQIESLYGDYDFSEFNVTQSPSMIFVLKNSK